jgi:hypothetical protein
MTETIFRGRRYSNDKRASTSDQAWMVVKQHAPHLTQDQCQQIVEGWLKSGLLYEQDYYDTKLRRTRRGLFVDNSKRPT